MKLVHACPLFSPAHTPSSVSLNFSYPTNPHPHMPLHQPYPLRLVHQDSPRSRRQMEGSAHQSRGAPLSRRCAKLQAQRLAARRMTVVLSHTSPSGTSEAVATEPLRSSSKCRGDSHRRAYLMQRMVVQHAQLLPSSKATGAYFSFDQGVQHRRDRRRLRPCHSAQVVQACLPDNSPQLRSRLVS